MLKQNLQENEYKKTRYENAKKSLERARLAHQKYLVNSYHNDLEDAIEYYIDALKFNPDLAQTYYRLACLLFEDGQISLETAVSQCKCAVKLEPLNHNARIYYGYFLQLSLKLDEAQKQFKKALKLGNIFSARPRFALALNYLKKLNNYKFSFKNLLGFLHYFTSAALLLPFDKCSSNMLAKHFKNDLHTFFYNFAGSVFEKLAQNKTAANIYKIALKQNNNNNLFYLKLANVYGKLNNQTKAIETYKKILKNTPNNAEILFKIIEANNKSKNPNIDESIDCYNKILNIKEPNYQIYYEIGHLYLKKNDKLNAANAFKLALEFAPENPYIHNSLGFTYVGLNLWNDAILHYREAIRINPDNEWSAIVCLALGSLYFEVKNEPDMAISLYETALALNPNSKDALVSIADIYSEIGKFDFAMKHYSKALKISPNDPKIYAKCAIALWENDFIEEAIIAYNKAIELKKDYDIAYNNLGVIYLDGIGNAKEALKLFKKAFELNSNYVLAIFNAGRAYEALKQEQKALNCYKKALHMNRNLCEMEENDILKRINRLFDV